jgi:NAD(P)H-flavin reductase
LVVVAGGTGITAVLEISEAAAKQGRNVVTIYSVAAAEEVLLRERLVGHVHIQCTEVGEPCASS